MEKCVGICERGDYECNKSEDCDKMTKCSNVECFCSINNLCEEPSESEEYRPEICDKAHAGTESKATIINCDNFILILGGVYVVLDLYFSVQFNANKRTFM